MPQLFTFITHPIVQLMNMSSELIPGVEKIVALYYDEQFNGVQCRSKSRTDHQEDISQLMITDVNHAKKIRASKFRYQWLSTANLPFETNEKSSRQFQIFDELDHVVLSIGIPNDNDSKTDILYIYLNHNKGNFGVAQAKDPLNTDEKAIVGSMAYNMLMAQIKRLKQDGQTLKTINKRVADIRTENDRLVKELEFLKEQHQIQLIAACNNALENLSANYGVNLSLSKDAKELLKSFTGSIDQLKQQLHHSAELAINLNFGSENHNLVLSALDLNLSDVGAPKSVPEAPVQDRYLKTWQLLDKLENAAQNVISTQQKLTSENVGGACPTPISAPAISDALKNHHKKVISLMENFPNRWSTIREEFRPVKNILQENAG